MELAELVREFKKLTEKVEILNGERGNKRDFAVTNASFEIMVANAFSQLQDSGRKLKVLAADINNNTTTLGDVLSIDLPTKGVFHFKAVIIFATAATTTGIKIDAQVPAGATVFAQVNIPQAADGTTSIYTGEITSGGDTVISTDSIGGSHIAIIEGHLTTGSTLGALRIRTASEVGGSNVVVYAKSFLIVDKIV